MEYKCLLVLNTSDIQYFRQLWPSQVLYTCDRDPLGGPCCSVKHSQFLETTPTLFLFGMQISYGFSVDLNDWYLHHATLVHQSSYPLVVSPLVTPLPILQSIHRPILPLPFLLCVTILCFLSWSRQLAFWSHWDFICISTHPVIMAPLKTKVCICKHCIKKGSVNSEGKAKGCSWEMVKYRAHILCIQCEEDEEQLSQAGGDMFASTIVDNNGTFNADGESSTLSSSLPIEAVVDGIQCMNISSNNLTAFQESTPSSLVEGIQHMHLNPDGAGPWNTCHTSDKQAQPHINAIHSEEMLLAVLDQLQTCGDVLHPPFNDDLQHIEATVRWVQLALEKVACSPASHSEAANIFHHEVQQKLNSVQSHLVELQNLSYLKEPSYFVLGMWLCFFVVCNTNLCYRCCKTSVQLFLNLIWILEPPSMLYVLHATVYTSLLSRQTLLSECILNSAPTTLIQNQLNVVNAFCTKAVMAWKHRLSPLFTMISMII